MGQCCARDDAEEYGPNGYDPNGYDADADTDERFDGSSRASSTTGSPNEFLRYLDSTMYSRASAADIRPPEDREEHWRSAFSRPVTRRSS